MTWIVGDVSASETLTSADHLYETHINQLRESNPPSAVVGTTSNCQYVCDGTADDVQIQAAIDAVATAGGGIVYIKEGTYNLQNNTNPPAFHSLITYYGIILKNKVALIGAGMGKTILNISDYASGASAGPAMIINGAIGDTDLKISDMTIQTPAAIPGVGGKWGGSVAIRAASRVILRDIRQINCGWEFRGNTVSFNATTKELTTDMEDILVDHVIGVDGHGSCSLVSIKHFSVRNCRFYGWTDDAFILVGAGQHGDFSNCIFDGQNKTTANTSSTAALFLSNDGSVSSDLNAVSDIKIIGCTMRRLTLPGGGLGGISFGSAKNIFIIGNLIERNNGRGISDNAGSTCEDIYMMGNTVRYNENSGIFLPNSANYKKTITLIGNKCYNNTGYGIRIDGGAAMDGITLIGNEVYDDQTPKTQEYGIVVSANGASAVADNVVVVDNNAYDNNTLNLSVSTGGGGTMTAIVRNNNGYVTENSGTGTIASGATSAVITHGLSRTPTLEDISIVGGENPTTDIGTIWVDTIGATYFTVNCEVAPSTSNFDFGWKAIITRTSF